MWSAWKADCGAAGTAVGYIVGSIVYNFAVAPNLHGCSIQAEIPYDGGFPSTSLINCGS